MNLEGLKLIIRLARFHFLTIGFLLYSIGYLLALTWGAQFLLSRFLLGYLVFGLAHLSVSFSNDYFDRVTDRKSEKTPFSGGSKVLVKHPELEKAALEIAILLLTASIVGIVLFAFAFGYSIWFVLFGVAGGLTGWFYTAPPVKLAYRGLGELCTMAAVGFLMPGMGYLVAAGTIGFEFIIFAFPLSLYGLFFIITVELPDLESDRLAQKKNVVVKWGIKAGGILSVLATVIGSISIAVIVFSEVFPTLCLALMIPLSMFPLWAAIKSVMTDLERREDLVKQVTINMTSLIAFGFGFNLILVSSLLF